MKKILKHRGTIYLLGLLTAIPLTVLVIFLFDYFSPICLDVVFFQL